MHGLKKLKASQEGREEVAGSRNLFDLCSSPEFKAKGHLDRGVGGQGATAGATAEATGATVGATGATKG